MRIVTGIKLMVYRFLINLGLLNPERLNLLTLHELYQLPDYVGKITEVSRDLKSCIDERHAQGKREGIAELRSHLCKRCTSKTADLLNR